jgi:hypothetical protein
MPGQASNQRATSKIINSGLMRSRVGASGHRCVPEWSPGGPIIHRLFHLALEARTVPGKAGAGTNWRTRGEPVDQAAVDLQKAIVAALIGGTAGEWLRIVVNYEVQEDDGGLIEDRLGFYIAEDAQQVLATHTLVFGPELKDLFRGLNQEMGRTGGARWGTCDLVVDPPGRFRFSFSYDPPKRINGIFDDDSMGRFDRYLEVYQAERSQ